MSSSNVLGLEPEKTIQQQGLPPLPAGKVDNISKVANLINDKQKTKINSIVYDYKAREIDESAVKPAELKTGTLVITAMLGTLALLLTGIGSLTGNFSLSKFLTYSFVGAGGLGFITSFSLYIKQFRKIVDKVRNEHFLDSNLNDFLSVVVYTLAGLTCLGFASTGLGCIILKSNINYLTSILMFTSVALQFGESIASFIKATKEKNYKEAWIELLNLISLISLAVCGAGILMNAPNGLMATVANVLAGISMTTVAALKFKDLYSKKQRVESVTENDIDSITDYLEEIIDLSNEEQSEIENKWKNKENKDLKNWIEKQAINKKSGFEWIKSQLAEEIVHIDETNYWKVIYDRINDNTEVCSISEENKKLVIHEEIKNRLNAKIEDFRARIDENIFKETLELYKKHLENKKNNVVLTALEKQTFDKNLKANFKKIKADMVQKIKAEMFKTCILYPALTAFPILYSAHVISETAYSFSFAFSLLCNLGINVNKKFRNVQPAVEEIDYEINNDLTPKPSPA